MYTEICAELGEAIAAASSTPDIQFHLIFEISFLDCVCQKSTLTREAWGANILCLPSSPCPPATGTEAQPEDYFVVGFFSKEPTFSSRPKENVLSTLYTLRLYPAPKSSERVRL